MLTGFCQYVCQSVFRQEGIRVKEKNVFSRCHAHGLIVGSSEANIAFVGNDSHVGGARGVELLAEVTDSAVFREVVDHEDFDATDVNAL